MQRNSIRPDEDDPIPGMASWSWAKLEMVMLTLAANDQSRIMVRHLVAGTRLESPFLTPEAIRRQLAMIFAALVDPSFPLEDRTMT